MTARMSRKGFEKTFGIQPNKPLTKRQRQRAGEINQLFDEMLNEYEMNSADIFRAAVEALHSKFLHDVRSCPQFVVAFCQHKLSPEAVAARKLRKNPKAAP